jgi:hypothetical protein
MWLDVFFANRRRPKGDITPNSLPDLGVEGAKDEGTTVIIKSIAAKEARRALLPMPPIVEVSQLPDT